MSAAQAPDAVDDGEEGDGSAGQKAYSEADDQGVVVLVDAMNHADDLQDAKAAEGDQGNALIALLAPEGNGLGHKEGGVAQKSQPEDERNNLPHSYRPPQRKKRLSP